jgi:hypothetical protein
MDLTTAFETCAAWWPLSHIRARCISVTVSLERMRPKPRPWRRGAAVGLKPASPLKKLPALRPTAGLASPEEMDQPGPSRPPARAGCRLPPAQFPVWRKQNPRPSTTAFRAQLAPKRSILQQDGPSGSYLLCSEWDFPEMSLAWSLLPGLAGQLRVTQIRRRDAECKAPPAS